MRYAAELKHCKSVRAVGLADATTGELVGKIIGHWSDNPAGSVCTVTLYAFGEFPTQTATAGGYGYDKWSDALARLEWRGEKVPYNGARSWFAERGVNYLEVL